MRSYQSRKCLCCKNCSKCQEFRKVISDDGLDIYIYVKHSKTMTKGKDVVENSGFIFNNMHNIEINKNDILQKIESSEFNCERCKTVLMQVSKILNEPIQENNILVICASCINRSMIGGLHLCKICNRIYDRFISSKKIQGVPIQDYANKWSSEIRDLLAEQRREKIDDKLIPSDVESQYIKTIGSHLRIVKDIDMEPERIDKKLMSAETESQGIETIKTQLPQTTLEEDIDTDMNIINLELKSAMQDIKKLSYLPQTAEKYDTEEITEITQKAISQEAFDYVFPKIDLKQVNLRKHISSSELIKDIEEKVDKDKDSAAIKAKKAEGIDGKKVKMKKQIWTNKHVHIDEEKVKSPSRSDSKTVNEYYSLKENEMVGDTDEIKKEQDIDEIGEEIKVKRKVKHKTADAGVEEKDVLGIKVKNKKKYKTAESDIDENDIFDIKIKKKEKYKAAGPDIVDKDALDKKVKKKSKHKDINTDDSEVPEKRRKEKGHKDEGDKKREKDVFKQMRSSEGSGDGFDFSKLLSKKKNKGDDENQKKKIKKSSKLSVSSSIQISSKKDKSQPVMPKESEQSEPEKSKKEKKPNIEKKSKSAADAPEDLKLDQVRIRNTSIDDFHIDMVKIKQSVFTREKVKKLPRLLSQISPSIDEDEVDQYKEDENKVAAKSSTAVFDDLEKINDKEVEELLQKVKSKEINEIIIGKKIVKHRKRRLDAIAKKNVQPMLFESTFKQLDAEVIKDETFQPEEKATPMLQRKSKSLHKFADQDASRGGIHYKLSKRSFIDKGWTMLPTEKIVRKMNIYRMRPSHPEFDWFEHNKDKRLMHYDTGETLAEIDEDGRGQWFYRNGRLALDHYNAEEVNAGQRYVVYSNGEPDEKGRPRPITVLATFDYLGNGIVFDHTGKVRLKYNQTEGAVLDKDIGPVSHWKWHELNDPPILQKVMIDTQMAIKDPEIYKMGGTGENVPRAENEEMLAIEFDNFIKEKSKKLTQKFKPFQIKMKALKINENFSLRVLDQATVYLLFRDGPTNLKLNLGMILDHKQIVDTDTAEVGEVTCNLERLPARTDSLAMLQRSVAHAQHIEKLRMERECRFRLSEVKPSIERLTAAVSRPLKVPVLTKPEIECMCSTRKTS